PPRLIHVGSKENSWAISICLSQVDIPCESVQEGYYTCLSHCWGRTRPFITTKANLEKNRQGIPWEALPKTFQDAVDITRSLGFQYVWIDSLCIVQDDADDWEKHCATMATIYRNASLVLAATASEDSQGGLFRRRSTKIQPHEDHHNRSSMPLLSRAWALQERLVSGAIVHFLDEEIIWECLEGYQCECGWSAEPNYYAPPLSWEDMVQAYTRRNLTFRKDLLPALSAIAERYEHSWDRWIKERPRDTYLAGLWRAELKLTMLWFTTESRKDADTDGTAPSWSWVSSPGMVVF
ncbi:HET-domain-containing protein, partial [Lophiostoma macrostomum CBS 122681]